MLVASGNNLFYHTWPTATGKHNYEIDFILSRANKIMPIEVKSSTYKTHASLDAFLNKYSSRIAESCLIYTKDLYATSNPNLLYLPVFMTMFL